MQVSTGLDLFTRLVYEIKPLWIEAGNIETAFLAKKLSAITIDQPVFISGLARAGSTILLEYIDAHHNVATHQYRDFPFIFTPYFSRKFTGAFSRNTPPKERAHGDRIWISPQSPEAMEEMLWQAFKTHGEEFAAFYRSHIQKLLLVTHKTRYAAKNNNLLTRLPTLLSLFPDARIVIPVRDPVSHIGSLMRQHARFMKEANHPRAIRHLKAEGHFEFGPTRHWHNSDELGGWIVEWNRIYGSAIPYLAHPNVMIVPYEQMCEKPEAWLSKISHHARLTIDATRQKEFAGRISAPDYYQSGFTEEEIRRIRLETAEINGNFTKPML